MSAENKYEFDGFTNLFGGPWSEPRNFFERLFVRPSAKTRAKGYYARFILAGWFRRFLKVLFILVLLKKAVYPASIYTYIAVREGSFSALVSLAVLFGAGFLIFKIFQRSFEARSTFRRSMKAINRGMLPPREVCAVPEVYKTVFRQDPRDYELDRDREGMARAMSRRITPPPPPITIKKVPAQIPDNERKYFKPKSLFSPDDHTLDGPN